MSETSILYRANGRLVRFHRTKKSYESTAEFSGRVLCEFENHARKNGATLAGLRFVVWDWHQPHNMGRFYTSGLGRLHEHTGNPYQDRFRSIPGLLDYTEAKAALRTKA